MADRPPPFALTIPSDLRLVPLARAFIESACHAFNLDRPACEALMLAAHEALQNVIRHAHCGRPESPLVIECLLLSEGMEVRISDEGGPFDIGSVPHYEPGELRIGGRGVYLMRRLLDELESLPRQPVGNVLRMVKRSRPGFVAAPRRHLA